MIIIIPSTDLRNNFADVERVAKESKEPIYLTKNGRGSLVIMDIDAFESYHENRAYQRFVEDALATTERKLASGLSQYQSMELAFEELLAEDPAAADDDGEENIRARHANA